MDLRVYYQKLRDIESEIQDAFPVVISRETPDGGKAGVKTQVPKKIAARMVANGMAELASAEEAAEFRARAAEDWRNPQEETQPPAQPKPARPRPTSSRKA